MQAAGMRGPWKSDEHVWLTGQATRTLGKVKVRD